MFRQIMLRCLAAGAAAIFAVGLMAGTASAEEPTRIVGQITKSTGQPVADLRVDIYDASSRQTVAFTRTDASGNYAAQVPNGAFKIEVRETVFPSQFFHQKRTFEEADLIFVTPGVDNVVNETLFPTGAIAFTATDKLTGQQIGHFCTEASGNRIQRSGCTDTGTVTIENLPEGDYSVSAFGNERYFFASSRATVAANVTTPVHFTLEPTAMITTIVQDAVTHEPVRNACVRAVDKVGGFGTFAGDCSGPDGRVTVDFLRTGRYRLYVMAKDGVHGDQWVGPNGGTGIEFLARTVDATAGQTVTVPPIQLDGAGSISGTVVDTATGAPVPAVCAFTHAGGTTGGPDSGSYCTKADGKYTINGVGPYVWPVQFIDTIDSHAWQWSGDRPTQLSSRPVTVQVGQITPLDAHLGPVATVSGRVTRADGQPPAQGFIQAYNAITGDPVANYALIDENGNYTLTGIAGPQFIRLEFQDGFAEGVIQWYRDSSGFDSADPVRSGASVTGIDFVLP